MADGAVRNALTCFMALRLPLAVQIATVLQAPGLVLAVCERRTAGTGPDGEQVRYLGHGCAVVRPSRTERGGSRPTPGTSGQRFPSSLDRQAGGSARVPGFFL